MFKSSQLENAAMENNVYLMSLKILFSICFWSCKLGWWASLILLLDSWCNIYELGVNGFFAINVRESWLQMTVNGIYIDLVFSAIICIRFLEC